jgi:hypothetical protein
VGDTDKKKTYYKIHEFKNALHDKYNGLDELEINAAYERCHPEWCVKISGSKQTKR